MLKMPAVTKASTTEPSAARARNRAGVMSIRPRSSASARASIRAPRRRRLWSSGSLSISAAVAPYAPTRLRSAERRDCWCNGMPTPAMMSTSTISAMTAAPVFVDRKPLSLPAPSGSDPGDLTVRANRGRGVAAGRLLGTGRHVDIHGGARRGGREVPERVRVGELVAERAVDGGERPRGRGAEVLAAPERRDRLQRCRVEEVRAQPDGEQARMAPARGSRDLGRRRGAAVVVPVREDHHGRGVVLRRDRSRAAQR